MNNYYTRFEAFGSETGRWAVIEIGLWVDLDKGGSTVRTWVIKDGVTMGEAIGLAAKYNANGKP